MFIHRQTMQALQAPALQQAMSACALYAIQTPQTKGLVHQVLQSNVQSLLTSTDPSSSSNPTLLAATQALLLYQLIRLFDGDVQLRASAEADESIALLWTRELRSRVCHVALRRDSTATNPVATFSQTFEDQEWLTWLFSESIRRTVVTAFMLQGVYNYHRTGDSTPTVIGVYFTAQAALWDAQSETSWCRARDERLELQVLIHSWDNMMALASPNDLEELGVLVMSMLWGLRSTQHWLGYDHSVKYGLDCQTWNQASLGPS
jgi:hypothetical protein